MIAFVDELDDWPYSHGQSMAAPAIRQEVAAVAWTSGQLDTSAIFDNYDHRLSNYAPDSVDLAGDAA